MSEIERFVTAGRVVIDRGSCAHCRVTPTKEIRGGVTTTVYATHWRCEDCNLEFAPLLQALREPRDAEL